jgi:hypothetical protein
MFKIKGEFLHLIQEIESLNILLERSTPFNDLPETITLNLSVIIF